MSQTTTTVTSELERIRQTAQLNNEALLKNQEEAALLETAQRRFIAAMSLAGNPGAIDFVDSFSWDDYLEYRKWLKARDATLERRLGMAFSPREAKRLKRYEEEHRAYRNRFEEQARSRPTVERGWIFTDDESARWEMVSPGTALSVSGSWFSFTNDGYSHSGYAIYHSGQNAPANHRGDVAAETTIRRLAELIHAYGVRWDG